jgi:hypothetical protein
VAPRRCVALLAALALAGGLSACGADDELSTDIPRTSPDLTIPSATTELPPADTTTSSTTDTTSTAPATGQGATPPAQVAPPQAVAPPVAPPASTTGGAGAGTGGQPTTGGASPDDPDFQNFCRDNPGAGPPC